MELLFEFIIDLIFDISVEVSKNKKVSKFIRYPLIILIVLFFVAVIGLIFFVGYLISDENLLGAIFIYILGLFMIVMSFIKFRKVYLIKNNRKSKEFL